MTDKKSLFDFGWILFRGKPSSRLLGMHLELVFRWYDLWLGAYWDRAGNTLYVCPLPTVVFEITFRFKVACAHRPAGSGEACNSCLGYLP